MTPRRKNLTSQLTVYVVTVGEPSLPVCMDALKHQDCTFQLDTISNVAPMDEAFNQMQIRCTTPFFVQVDADMILYPGAIRQLYEDITAEAHDVLLVAYPLRDVHMEKSIVGVKIYRTELAQKYPWQKSFACEMDQLARATADGIRYEVRFHGTDTLEGVLGTHGGHYTWSTAFERYRNLFQRYRQFDFMGWVYEIPAQLVQQFVENPTEANLWAVMGMVVGLTSSLDDCTSEKDFRTYRGDPALRALQASLGPGDGPKDVNVYVTSRCNLNCWFCNRATGWRPDAPDYQPGHVDELLTRFPMIKQACLAGFGEPLLHQNLAGIVQRFNDHDIVPSIVTNGLLLKDAVPKLAGLNLLYLSVSLNEPDAVEYYDTHQVDAYHEVVEGIRAAVAGLGYRVGMSAVVTRNNLERMPDFIRLGKELGVDFMNLVAVLPHEPLDDTFWELAITQEDAETLQAIATWKDVPGAELVEHWPVPVSRDAAKCPNVCQSPWRSIGVNGTGAYSPCRRVTGPGYTSNNILNNPMWYGRHYREWRESVQGVDGAPWRSQCVKCFGNWGDY